MANRKSKPRSEIKASDFRLHLKGRWRSRQRQVVEIWYRQRLLGTLALGPARWSVLASLVRAAMRASLTDSADMYLTKDEIARILEEMESPFAFAGHIKAYLHALREDLDSFVRGHLGQAPGEGGWGELLIGTHTLGYFIAVPRDRLRLTDLDRR